MMKVMLKTNNINSRTMLFDVIWCFAVNFEHFTAQKMKFSIKDFSVNVTKSTVSCGLGHNNWRNA